MGSVLGIALGYYTILNKVNRQEIQMDKNMTHFIFDENCKIKITRHYLVGLNNYQTSLIGTYDLEKGDNVTLEMDIPNKIKLIIGNEIIQFTNSSIDDLYMISIPINCKYHTI